ncbi:MAG: DUF2878 domain-containing protein [Halioglobus sp.]|nr:DUF2878 domain-containing protein [Halioglobus sp.]
MDIANRLIHAKTSASERQARATSFSSLFLNGLLFNLSWFAIVVSHSPLIAPIIVLLHLFIHFRWFAYGIVEARFIIVVTAVGAVLDQILFFAGILTSYSHGPFAPLWLSCLWPVLATTLMHAFSGLQSRLALASVVGAIGGAGSYVAGTRLSDVAFTSFIWGPVVMAVAWAILFPALVLGAKLASEGRGKNVG